MAGGQIKYSKPCFDKFREYILKSIPRKYKAGGKDILTQIDSKELEGLKTSIHKAEMLLNPIIGELKEERENIAEKIETENQRDYFKDRYNTEVLTVVSNFFKLVIEINEDIIPNEEVKADFYRSMEYIKKEWKERVFKDFNNGNFTQFNKGVPSRCQHQPVNHLRPEFEDRLNEIEREIQTKVKYWKSGKDKIGCAAFVEMLYDKKYLKQSKKENRKICIEFALYRYGLFIKNQKGNSKDTERKKHEMYFKKYFE